MNLARSQPGESLSFPASADAGVRPAATACCRPVVSFLDSPAGGHWRSSRASAGRWHSVLLLFATVLLWVLPVAWGGAPAPARLQRPRKVVLQFPWTHGFQFAGYYAALERGYYREAGLDVELREGGPAVNIIAKVLDGRADFGVSNADLLYARLVGQPVVVLAPIFQHSPSALLTLKSSGIEHLHDLAGKRVMLGSGHHGVEYRMMFKREGLALDQLQIVEYSLSLDDLVTGRADACDAYLSDEPFRLTGKGIPFRLFRPVTYGVDFYGDTLFTSDRKATRHHALAAAFRAASLRGWRYAMEHPREIMDLIQREYAGSLSRDKLQYEYETFRQLMLPDIVAVGHSNPGRWRTMARAFLEVGLIDMDIEDIDARLAGFFLQPLDPQQARLAAWVRYGAMVLLVALILLLFSLLWIHMLSEGVRSRTDALEAAHAEHYKLFEHSISAVCICEMMLDEEGRPVDYIITRANAAFERHAIAKREDILGKPITETHPGIEKTGLIERLGRVAMSRVPETFDFYLPLADRHYHIQAYQVSPGRCAVLFADISEQKRLEACRKVQVLVSRALLEVRSIPDLLQQLPGVLAGMPLVDGGGLYRLDSTGQTFLLKAHWGLSPEFVTAVERFGIDSDNGRQVLAGRNILRFHLRSARTGRELADGQLGLSAMAAFPLVTDGKAMGCLNFGATKADAFPGYLVATMEILAGQIASTIARLQSDAQVRRSESRYARLSEHSRTVVWETDLEGRFTYVSPSVLASSGWQPEEIVGRKGLLDFIAPDHHREREQAARFLKDLKPVRNLETRMIAGDGSIRSVIVNGVPIFDDFGEPLGYQGSTVDITEEKRMEQQILDISTFERERIGHDLHDFLGQQLTGIHYLAGTLEKKLKDRVPAELTTLVQRIGEEARKSVRLTRQIVMDLLPMKVDELGLPQALEVMAANVQATTGVTVQVAGDSYTIHDQQVDRHLYHIAVEAVSNAIRHGAASRVKIVLRQDADQGLLQVEDDGQGLTDSGHSQGMGLRIMKYRAHQIGAHLEIGPNEPTGVRVACRFPAGRVPEA